MFLRRNLVSLALGGPFLAGCGGRLPQGKPTIGPVRTKAEAIAAARVALRGRPEADHEPLEVQGGPDSQWVVTTRKQPTTAGGTTATMVMIDPKTGRAIVGGYATTTINEDL